MSRRKLFFIFGLLALQVMPSQAQIGSSIVNSVASGIKNVMASAAKTLGQLMQNFFISVKNYVTNMLTDIQASFTMAEKLAKKRANETMTDLLNLDGQKNKVLIKRLMFQGDLPQTYYLLPLDLEIERDNLKNGLDMIKNFGLVVLTCCIIFTLVLIGLLVFFCNLKVAIRRLDYLEKSSQKRLEAQKKARKNDEEEIEALKNKMVQVALMKQNDLRPRWG